MPVWFVQSSPTRYEIWASNISGGPDCDIGHVLFNPVNPPHCSYACTEQLNTQMPGTFVEHIDPLNTQDDECNDNLKPNELRGAFFTPLYRRNESSNLFQFTPDDVDACFDEQRQKWSFELYPEFVSLNVVSSLCRENIENYPAEIIYSLSDIDNLNSSECHDLKRSILGHKDYPWKDIKNGYFFAEIAYAHEYEHEKDWVTIKNKHYESYLTLPSKINFYLCEQFANATKAKEEYLKQLRQLFTRDFWVPLSNEFYYGQFLHSSSNKNEQDLIDKNRRRIEEEVQQRSDVQALWIKYKNKIISKCGQF